MKNQLGITWQLFKQNKMVVIATTIFVTGLYSIDYSDPLKILVITALIPVGFFITYMEKSYNYIQR
jgi:hypothetical protein